MSGLQLSEVYSYFIRNIFSSIFLLSFHSLILVSIFSICLYFSFVKDFIMICLSNYVCITLFQLILNTSIYFSIDWYSYLSERLHDLAFNNTMMMVFLKSHVELPVDGTVEARSYVTLHCIYFYSNLCSLSIWSPLIG